MNIGEASKATGISVKMLRYYEEIGLVRPALRTHSGYRVYTEKHIAMLRFVKSARDLGFQVKQIAALMDLWLNGSRSSADVKSLALAHAAELIRRRQELDEMISTLQGMANHCRGDQRPDCSILAALSSDRPSKKPATAKRGLPQRHPGLSVARL